MLGKRARAMKLEIKMKFDLKVVTNIEGQRFSLRIIFIVKVDCIFLSFLKAYMK